METMHETEELRGGSETLFRRLGGRAAVEAAVDRFYDKVIADERIQRFFTSVDMKRQRGKQKAFLTYAFGGAPSYSGTSLRKAHEALVREQGLDDAHFDAVAENLQRTLEELGVGPALVAEVMTIAGAVRDDVLNR